jgi:hypothetical protein
MLGPGAGLKGLQRVNQAFRNTVLPLSTEVADRQRRRGRVPHRPRPRRAVVVHDRPPDVQAARGAEPRRPGFDEAKRAWRPGSARSAAATSRWLNGPRSSGRPTSSTTFGAAPAGTRVRGVRARTGPEALGKLWGAYTHAVFGANSVVERQFQTALAGKYAREFMVSPKDRLSWNGGRAGRHGG